MYAEAGIPVYWRVELQGMPKIVACSLSHGRYVTRTTLVAGTPGRITRPFAVELDPDGVMPHHLNRVPRTPWLIWCSASTGVARPQRVGSPKWPCHRRCYFQ